MERFHIDTPKATIGYWMSEKKSQKLNWYEFARVCRENGYELIKLDLDLSLDQQGPFDIIIHKLNDIISLAGKGDEKAMKKLEHVESYIAAYPEVLIIDPFENVRKLLDRYKSYRVVIESGLHEIDVFTPPFVELTCNDVEENIKLLRDAGVAFPFVCKPSAANGTEAHNMAIVFNEKGLKDCHPPCVAHSFVNHNAILYKIFIVGNEYHIVERPSLKNFYADPDRKTIHFNSHNVSKPDSSCSLNVLDDLEETERGFTSANTEKLKQIADVLREKLGMNLLGIDVVVENTTGRHAIIDMNPYPEPDDSGIDTADSSDEKKRRPAPLIASKTIERRL